MGLLKPLVLAIQDNFIHFVLERIGKHLPGPFDQQICGDSKVVTERQKIFMEGNAFNRL